MGALIEALVVVAIVPTIVCCALTAAVSLVALVLPWLALATIAAIVATAAAAVTMGRRQYHPPLEHPLPPPGLGAVRRPAGIRERREERRD